MANVLCVGHSRYGRSEGGIGHHTNRRQLYEYRQGGDVGSQRVRQHRQVPSVPADCQHRRSHRRFSWSLCYQGRFIISLSISPSLCLCLCLFVCFSFPFTLCLLHTYIGFIGFGFCVRAPKSVSDHFPCWVNKTNFVKSAQFRMFH